MRSRQDDMETETTEAVWRLDRGHTRRIDPSARPVLRRRRVRQVLVGSPGESAEGPLRLCGTGTTRVDVPRNAGRMLTRFRNNLHTLNHIARDPLVWQADEGLMLTELREALCLTETALRHFETWDGPPSAETTTSEAIVTLANLVDDRVDHLFERMERLAALRQSMFRLSGIIESVRFGDVPRVHDIEELATTLTDLALQELQTVTLLDPEAEEPPVCIAAHAVNVAQVVARLARAVPAWSQELTLAVSAALLQDLGMITVPPALFRSTDLLTAPQRMLVQQHPVASAEIVQSMRGHDERLVAAVYQHHERLDGSGYPEHLRGSAMSPVARLLAVADTYVGIQSPRPYRPAFSRDQALAEMDRNAAEGRLDPAWTCRLREIETHWVKVPTGPEPPTGAPALSARAA